MTKSGGTGSSHAASDGGPVNLATGEEEYTPDPDIVVYNPAGPSVVWRRIYNSSSWYTSGFGSGWSHPHNIGVEATNGGIAQAILSGPDAVQPLNTISGNVVFPNGSKASFTGNAPTASAPHQACTLSAGYPFKVVANYDSATGTFTFTVTHKNRTSWTTGAYANGFIEGADYGGSFLPVASLSDPVGNTIKFQYGSYTAYNGGVHTSVQRLREIDDSAGSALLTIGMDSLGDITSVSDRYGRSVYYGVGTYATLGVPAGYQTSYLLINQVSQIVATGTASPPVRYQYGYANFGNQEAGESIPYLHTISVPSPTGAGMATATINYNSSGYVSTVVDANGNVTQYTDTSGTAGTNETTVQIKSASGTVVRQFAARFDSNMNETQLINGLGQTVYTRTYGSSSTPFRPSSVQDGNGRTWHFTWDQFNNLLTLRAPKGTTTANTYVYGNFSLGELTSSQQGSKTATSYTYYEPSGLVHQVSTPIPGDVGTGATQTTTYAYDSLGNLTQATSPGNNAVASHTVTYGYTTDGGYAQLEALGEPITVTDSLGKVTHLRWDSRGNLVTEADPLGNLFSASYNLANQLVTTTLPGTGQTGYGSASQTNAYLYVGGPLVQTTAADESGAVVRTINLAYGLEGETLSRTGSAEAVSLTYDPAYATKTLSDGNGNATVYSYDLVGRTTKISYPGATGANYDQVQFTSYDPVNNLLSRTDGNGQVTNYTYGDADGLLSAVAYPGATGYNVSLGFDLYDRLTSETDGSGSATSSYDDLDGTISATRTYTGLSAQSATYAYWPDGSRKTMSNVAGTWSYAYDANGRYTSLASPAGTSSATYLDNGWESSRTLPNGAVTNYSYNAAGMLMGLTNQTSGGTTLSQYGSFTYDGVFNLTGLTASVPGVPSQGGATSYGYDAKDRLTSESSARNGGYSSSFGYDASGEPDDVQGRRADVQRRQPANLERNVRVRRERQSYQLQGLQPDLRPRKPGDGHWL